MKISNEKDLLGKRVRISCRDRMESEYDGVTLTSLTEKGALINYESRGTLWTTFLPTHILDSIDVKSGSVEPTKEDASEE
jgi:hypothetical protein